jgi:hypothetical protein
MTVGEVRLADGEPSHHPYRGMPAALPMQIETRKMAPP